MHVLRRGARALRVVAHIGAGFVVAFGVGGFFPSAGDRPAMRRATRWWLGKLTRILGIEATVTGAPAADAALVVANHVSWTDIPVLGGLHGVHFLSKTEVAGWPLIGSLATAAGTLYIRRGQGQVRERTRQIAAHLADGRSILVFPEGTTTDGHDVLPFHAPLFAAATDSGRPVQPVAIRYLDAAGQPHAYVPFVGDDEFTAHLWRLLSCGRIRVEVHFLPPVAAPGGDPRALAAVAHARVRHVVAAAGVPAAASVVGEPVGDGVARELLAPRA